MRKNLELSIEQAMTCKGWTSSGKLKCLAGLLDKVENVPGEILEIGSAWGRSAVFMTTYSDRRLVSIDPHTGGLAYLNTESKQDSGTDFLDNLKRCNVYDRVSSIFKTTEDVVSERCIPEAERFALIFIDGLHTAEAVEIDWNFAMGHVSPGGIIVFDDYFEPSVKAYSARIDELVAQAGLTLLQDDARLVYCELAAAASSTRSSEERAEDGSYPITDRTTLDRFNAEPNNTYFVSFPRTGSHWLRLIMELYFERPSLTRAFYFPENTDYLTLHTHDMELDVVRDDVIYLYRDPVETVYSQLNYYKESTSDPERITYWARYYGRHLERWLDREDFTKHKTVVTYEGLKSDLCKEFSKITDHFGVELCTEKLLSAASKVSKSEVKRKTAHDQQVVTISGDYDQERAHFKETCGDLIVRTIRESYPCLKQYI